MKPWCALFSPDKSGGLVQRWLVWNLFEFVDIISVWILSFFILQVLDRRWKKPKLQVSDVRCKVKGCWCSMMFVGRFRADLQYYKVATMYPQGFRSLKEITTCFPCFFRFLFFLTSVQLVSQPFFCNHFGAERHSSKSALWSEGLCKGIDLRWFEQMWLGSDRLLSRLICFSDFAEDKGGNMILNESQPTVPDWNPPSHQTNQQAG